MCNTVVSYQLYSLHLHAKKERSRIHESDSHWVLNTIFSPFFHHSVSAVSAIVFLEFFFRSLLLLFLLLSVCARSQTMAAMAAAAAAAVAAALLLLLNSFPRDIPNSSYYIREANERVSECVHRCDVGVKDVDDHCVREGACTHVWVNACSLPLSRSVGSVVSVRTYMLLSAYVQYF